MIRDPMPAYSPRVETDSGVFFKVATMLLGLGVGVLAVFAVLMWTDARDNRDQAAAAAPSTPATHDHSHTRASA